MLRPQFAMRLVAAGIQAASVLSPEPLTSQTLPLSPTVLATVASRPHGLEVLVLWRGARGWYMSGEQRGASYAERAGVVEATIAYGGVTLELAFDARKSIVWLQGAARSGPVGTNVLLIDDVDSRTGPKIVETLAVPAAGPVDPRTGTLAPFVKRAPAIAAFLQCDAARAGGRDPALRRIVCDELDTP